MWFLIKKACSTASAYHIFKLPFHSCCLVSLLNLMNYKFILVPPTVVTALANESTVFEKKESRHECVFDARPSPTIKWYLNNIEMNNIRYNINTTTIGYIGDTILVRSILVINSSMPEDTGVISCIAILPNANISSANNHVVLCKYFTIISNVSSFLLVHKKK